MNQVECHPYLSQSKLKEFCEKRGILLTGYSPLGSPDKPFKEENQPEPLLQDTTVQDIAKRNNKSAAQVLLRWQVMFFDQGMSVLSKLTLTKPMNTKFNSIIFFQVQRGVIVIPKSVTPKRIEENFDVFNFSLSNDDMKLLNSMDLWYSERKGRYINDFIRNWKGPDGMSSPHFPFDIEF